LRRSPEGDTVEDTLEGIPLEGSAGEAQFEAGTRMGPLEVVPWIGSTEGVPWRGTTWRLSAGWSRLEGFPWRESLKGSFGGDPLEVVE
jgi:hypothetical protein